MLLFSLGQLSTPPHPTSAQPHQPAPLPRLAQSPPSPAPLLCSLCNVAFAVQESGLLRTQRNPLLLRQAARQAPHPPTCSLSLSVSHYSIHTHTEHTGAWCCYCCCLQRKASHHQHPHPLTPTHSPITIATPRHPPTRSQTAAESGHPVTPQAQNSTSIRHNISTQQQRDVNMPEPEPG